MTKLRILHQLLIFLIAAVWLINGFFCKVMNLVPRHQLIVSRILGAEHAALLTKVIGVAEILMAIWILSRIKTRLCAPFQIVLVAGMNTIELFTVPDLLLFGKLNAIWALLFIVVVYCNEFVLNKKSMQPAYDLLPE